MKFFTIVAGILVIFTALASAINPSGDYKVYGKSLWSWNNNWNDPNKVMKATFGGNKPSINVTFEYGDNNIHAYPALIRGWHYNVNPLPDDNCFPKLLKGVQSLKCYFDYKCGGTHLTGDFAYDLFLRPDTEKTTPQLEVMIWGDHNSIPIGSQTGTAVITGAGKSFDLWEGFNSGAGYYVYSFVPTNTVKSSVGATPLGTSGTLNLDVMTFLNWLLENKTGHFTSDWYLDVVEMGFEAGGGKGWAYMEGAIGCPK